MKNPIIPFLLLIHILIASHSFSQWTVIHQPDLADFHMFDLHVDGDRIIAVGYKADGAASIFRSVILISSDEGATWTEVFQDGRFLKTIDFTADGTGYIGGFGVGSSSFVMISTDNGETWTDHFTDFNNAGITHLEFVDENTGYATGYGAMQFFNPNIYETRDGGNTWNIRLESAPQFTTFDRFTLVDGEMYALSSVYFSGTVTGNEMSYSADSGKTWIQIVEHEESLGGMAWIDGYTGFIITSTGGIEKTTDGGVTWNEIYSTGGDGLFAITIEGETGYAVGANGTILKSTDSGENWTPENSGTTKALAGINIIDGKCYALGEDGIVLRFGAPGNGGDGGDLPPSQWPIGVEDAETSAHGHSIFPNPITDDRLTVTVPGLDAAQNTHFLLFNAFGALKNVQRLESVEHTIDLPSLSPGIYHYVIRNDRGDESGRGKLVRQ